jgi:4'-phosphopantetheinyl transferase
MSQNRNITDSGFRIEERLALPDDEVQLWRVELDAIRADESRWLGVLSADEAARASRFHFSTDRQRFVASRALLRMILAGYLATDASRLLFSYSKKEKPSLGPEHAGSDVTFNVSHSGGIALLAFTRRREIGVDVELVRRDFDVEAIARRFFSAQEQEQLAAFADETDEKKGEKKFDAFFRCWTRKEAYIKATGEGLSLPLRQFDVSIAEGDHDALRSTRPDPAEAALWSLREILAGSGYVAALCVRGHDWQLRPWSGQAAE